MFRERSHQASNLYLQSLSPSRFYYSIAEDVDFKFKESGSGSTVDRTIVLLFVHMHVAGGFWWCQIG